jgi:hypothetical protein
MQCPVSNTLQDYAKSEGFVAQKDEKILGGHRQHVKFMAGGHRQHVKFMASYKIKIIKTKSPWTDGVALLF